MTPVTRLLVHGSRARPHIHVFFHLSARASPIRNPASPGRQTAAYHSGDSAFAAASVLHLK